MALDLPTIISELSDLATANATKDDTAAKLLAATVARAQTESEGEHMLTDLAAQQIAQTQALREKVAAANALAQADLNAAEVAARVAAALYAEEEAYVIALVKQDRTVKDPTP